MGVCRELVRRSIVWVAVLILAAIPVAAQLPTGAILGTVKDSSGASVPGATVTVRNTDTNFTRTQMTEQDGSYRFPELPVGHYEIRAEAAGFRTETRTGLIIPASDEAGCRTGIVTATGSDVQGVEPGDKVLFPKDSGFDIRLGGSVAKLLRRGELIARV